MAQIELMRKAHVPFDPEKEEHRAAYLSLRRGRMDKNLRFICEEGYSCILTMMQDKIAHWACTSEAVSLGVRLSNKKKESE